MELVAPSCAGNDRWRQEDLCGSHQMEASTVAKLDAFLCVARAMGTYDDLLFVCLLSCCFYACHRSGKLVWKNQKDLQDWQKVIKRASLCFTDGRAGYRLPYHKAV